MSIKLTVDGLISIANAVSKLKDTGIDVNTISICGHTVYLRQPTSQEKEVWPDEFIIVGIREGEVRPGGALRDGR